MDSDLFSSTSSTPLYQSSRPRYDTEPGIFSPEGRLLQAEYAFEAVKWSSTMIAIRFQDGIILATKPRPPQAMADEKVPNRFIKVSNNIIGGGAGFATDIEHLMNHARQESLRHRLARHQEIPCERVVRRVSELMQGYSQHRTLRPFGAFLLFAGYSELQGFQLFTCRGMGAYFSHNIVCFGHGGTKSERFLKRYYSQEMTRDKACEIAVEALRRANDSKDIEAAELQITEMKRLSSGELEINFMTEDDIDKVLRL